MTFPPAAAVITVRKFFGTRAVSAIALILSPPFVAIFQNLTKPAICGLASALRISAGRRASACRRWGKISRAGASALYDFWPKKSYKVLIIINYFALQQTLAQWQFVARGERLASVPIGVKHSPMRTMRRRD